MERDLFAVADQHQYSGRYADAFAEYARIAASDPQVEAALRAKAWYSMGLVAEFAPTVSLGECDGGMVYYRKAIQVDPGLLDPWRAIVSGFGEFGGSWHHDVAAFRRAVRHLQECRASLDDSDRSMLDEQVEKYRHLLLSGA